MTVGSIFFVVCSLVSIVGALGTVLARNPIRGAIGLLATIFGIAGNFLQLQAQFLAAIQLMVYAGAVVVLFVFVIMLLGPDAGAGVDPKAPPARARWSRFVGAGLFLLLVLIGAGVLASIGATPTRFGKAAPDHGSVEAVGRLLFTSGLVPFELATALLIVAVVGAIAVARSRYGAPQRKPISNPKQLFHGPLHPRDAGHPLPKEGLS
jgi:NADH-quinone oxidoreductase subunit J